MMENGWIAENERLKGMLARVNVQRIDTVRKMNQMEHDKNMEIAALTALVAESRRQEILKLDERLAADAVKEADH